MESGPEESASTTLEAAGGEREVLVDLHDVRTVRGHMRTPEVLQAVRDELPVRELAGPRVELRELLPDRDDLAQQQVELAWRGVAARFRVVPKVRHEREQLLDPRLQEEPVDRELEPLEQQSRLLPMPVLQRELDVVQVLHVVRERLGSVRSDRDVSEALRGVPEPAPEGVEAVLRHDHLPEQLQAFLHLHGQAHEHVEDAVLDVEQVHPSLVHLETGEIRDLDAVRDPMPPGPGLGVLRGGVVAPQHVEGIRSLREEGERLLLERAAHPLELGDDVRERLRVVHRRDGVAAHRAQREGEGERELGERDVAQLADLPRVRPARVPLAA